MGGGGVNYDRDVTDRRLRNLSTGVSSTAERVLTQSYMDPGLLPKNRRLVCKARNPLVYNPDVTGSMQNLPKILWDKAPGIVGQINARAYLPDPEMSLTATGDIRSDYSPLQMCDFEALRNLDLWWKRIHFEGNGGGQGSESYETTAYYYVKYCDMPKAELPIYLITGDEGFVERLYARDLVKHFGGEHEDTTAEAVFADLLRKFKDNVFLVHRRFSGRVRTDKDIVAQWEGVLGTERIIHLPEDLAVGDITLGVYAIVSGARTLKQYLEDMGTRDLEQGAIKYEPQSPERIRQVEEALQPLKDFKPVTVKKTVSVGAGAPKSPKDKEKKKKSWKL